MVAGNLTRLYAFEVFPGEPDAIAGGLVASDPILAATLASAFDASDVATAPRFNFNVDLTNEARLHTVRDSSLKVAFSTRAETREARRLAARLASSMDRRSRTTLFVVSVHEARVANARRLVMWTFPREEVFSLSTEGDRASLVLGEAFNSQSSELRKIALLEDHSAGMYSARVRDFQTALLGRSAADYWTAKFLDARVQLGSAEGTELLSRALRSAYEKTRGDWQAQGQINIAIEAVRGSNRTNWSLDALAELYLSGSAADAYRDAVRPDELSPQFDVDRNLFGRLIQYRRFQLDNGVIVSAPFSEVGASESVRLEVDDNGTRTLVVRGEVEEEQVRARG